MGALVGGCLGGCLGGWVPERVGAWLGEGCIVTGMVQKREGHSYIAIDTQVGGAHEDPGLHTIYNAHLKFYV